MQPMRLPQALHGAQADADGFGHGAAGPRRGVARRLGAGQVHNLGDDLGRKRSTAGFARLVAQQAIDALLSVSRACQRQTEGRLTSARRATSCTGKRSAEQRTMCARCTCLSGRLRSATMASRR